MVARRAEGRGEERAIQRDVEVDLLRRELLRVLECPFLRHEPLDRIRDQFLIPCLHAAASRMIQVSQ